MATPQSSERIAAKVGLFILIGIIILAAGILTLGTMRKSFITRIDATATFESVNGLTKGNNVWFAGVKVGTVREIAFTPDSKVRVIFSIEDKSQPFIKQDATVRVSSDGLIGNPIILISGGSPNAKMIENGFNFKVEADVSQQEMLKTLQANNKNILSITDDLKGIISGIRAGEGSVGKLMKDEAIYANISKSMATVEAATRDLKKGVTTLANLTDKLNTEGNFINSIAADKEIYPAIKNTVNSLQNTTETLKETSVAAKKMVSDLEQTTSNLVNNPKSPVGVLLHDEKAANNIRETISNLESSSEKLDQNLEALKHNFLFRRYFRKQAKEEEKKKTEQQQTSQQ
ncbi:MlaD family protein [Emticicia sp. 17c]|uniref:MlaD family protein n=1 Tax=Emticicia sp. 17c TaxID=3127704 RepID=UPI00301E3B05